MTQLNTPDSDVDKPTLATILNNNFTESTVATASTKENDTNWLWLLVLPIWLVYIANQWSRSSLYYLVNFDTSASAFTAMNVDLHFDETQYGLLASVAFTLLFAIASLGAGYAADRWDRVTLTVASAFTVAAAVAATAAAPAFGNVLAARILMGLASAFATPTAYTLIRDRVPALQQATAASIYGTGVALGSGLASYTLVLDDAYGWRMALSIIAATGCLAGLLTALVVPSDDRKDNNMEGDKVVTEESAPVTATESLFQDIQSALQTDRAQWIYRGSFLRFCSGLCIGVWGAPYFRMTFADRTTDYAYSQAAISALGASASGVLGGALADRAPDRKLWVPVVGSLLAAPTWYLAMHSADSFEVAMIWLAAEYLVAECWFGPTISTLQATVGPKIGGTAQGLFTLTGAAANFAPAILGYLYGQSTTVDGSTTSSSSTELSTLLSIAVCFGYVSSAFCFAMAANAAPTVTKKES
jgi:MFS family permease